MTAFLSIAGVWIAAFLTLGILSFLYKDNPFYKFAEHLVVGISAGYWFVTLWQTSFLSLVYDPFKADLTGGALFASSGGFLTFLGHLTVFVLGSMVWLRFYPKASWLARIPIAFVLGTGAGVAIPTYMQNNVLSQVAATLTLPIVPTSWQVQVAALLGSSPPGGDPVTWWKALFNLLLVGGTACGLVYFFFSKEHKGVTGKAANVGIWVLMIGFGATFGSTVMSRVSLLVGRFEFLLNTWFLDSFWRLIFPK